jgi:hypothetical protein
MADEEMQAGSTQTGSQARRAAARPGFNSQGKPYPGVDPETGERRALTYEGAQKEFGPRRGAEVYAAVAMAGGFGRVEGNPDLSLVGLEGEHKKQVDEILAATE